MLCVMWYIVVDFLGQHQHGNLVAGLLAGLQQFCALLPVLLSLGLLRLRQLHADLSQFLLLWGVSGVLTAGMHARTHGFGWSCRLLESLQRAQQ